MQTPPKALHTQESGIAASTPMNATAFMTVYLRTGECKVQTGLLELVPHWGSGIAPALQSAMHAVIH